MEKRDIDRIKQKFAVRVEDQQGILIDFSKRGMKLLITTLLKKRDIDVFFQFDNFILAVKCYVCWIKKELNIYRQPQYQVGVYIHEPPEEYALLVETMQEK